MRTIYDIDRRRRNAISNSFGLTPKQRYWQSFSKASRQRDSRFLVRYWRKADASSLYNENNGKISGPNANLVPSPCATAVWSPVFSGRVGWLKANLIERPSMTSGNMNLRSLVKKSADPDTLPDIYTRP